jgi:hypothetical protein
MLPEQRKRTEWQVALCFDLDLPLATEVPAQSAFPCSAYNAGE